MYFWREKKYLSSVVVVQARAVVKQVGNRSQARTPLLISDNRVESEIRANPTGGNEVRRSRRVVLRAILLLSLSILGIWNLVVGTLVLGIWIV